MMRHAAVETATPAQPHHRKTRKRRVPRRTAARLRLLRQRARGWKRQARRAATLALIGAMTAQAPLSAYAQFGQAPMGQPQGVANGVFNNGLARLGDINNAGPGFMYYGINAADRGLGYIGSYMTLGGFIPYAQDDLGGFWSADLRGHLSVNGGFFSNVGVVRKQLLGNGSLLGVGVYWDYDGDLYQYAGQGNSSFGQFGHVYNQVGVSGEILTDWGDIRSNGYMPVGTTAYTVGAPGTPFYQNQILCQYGLDAALGGADLEVGAYIPALADFAGMISVGGYALGNTFNKWQTGSNQGLAIVPWFGGVYTRIDMTFANNWDFSLQYNNDSFFDSTGFARLTYRMGGSRRRNVPDQLEQPMMRNEHIVRGHQTPELAYNSATGATWNVIHVDNSTPTGGTGTAESPFTTLQEAQAAATNPWDIVYVKEGTSTLLSGTTYGGTFAFQAADQSLVGSGNDFTIAVQPGCGTLVGGNWLYTIEAQTAANPVLSAPGVASIATNNEGGLTIANLTITGSGTGISGTGNLTGTAKPAGTTANPMGTTAAGATAVRNVTISGDGTAAPQTGLAINAASGAIELSDLTIGNMNRNAVLVQNSTVDFELYGTLFSDFANNGMVASPIIDINNNTNSTIDIAFNGPPANSVVPNSVTDIGGGGILIDNNDNQTVINIGNVSLIDSATLAIHVFNDAATTQIAQDAGAGILKTTNGAAIQVEDGTSDLAFEYQGGITNSGAGGTSYLLSVSGTAANSSVTVQANPGSPLVDLANGISIHDAGGNILLTGGTVLSGATPQGILIDGAASGNYTFQDVGVTAATNEGVLINGNQFSGVATFETLEIALNGATARGLVASNTASSGTLVIGDASNIDTASTAAPSLQLENIANVSATLVSVTSGVDNATGTAIDIGTGTGGTIDITSSFTVGGAAGTNAAPNVINAGTATITIPPP
jgi:hypothetical protein